MDFAQQLTDLRNQSAEQLIARASQVLPPWVALLLVIGIAWQLAKITFLLLPGEERIAQGVPLPAPVQEGGDKSSQTVDIQSIVDAHLFGKMEAPVITAPAISEEPAEPLKGTLVLKGTIAATADQKAMAIIEDRGKETVYAIGDAVPGGGKLHAVEPAKVIFQQSGRLAFLELPKEFANTRPVARRSTRTTRSLPTTPAPAPRSTTDESTSVRDLLSQDPARLTDIIRPQPVFQDGQQRGYRVYPGRKRDQFAQLGLKPGDLVTEINGTALDDPARGMEIFRSLGDAGQVSVTVERNGESEVLMLDTAVLTDPDSM